MVMREEADAPLGIATRAAQKVGAIMHRNAAPSVAESLVWPAALRIACGEPIAAQCPPREAPRDAIVTAISPGFKPY